MCSPGSKLEIFPKSQDLPSAGVKGANGMYEVPYVFLRSIKKVKEIEVIMNEGGMYVLLSANPRISNI